MPFLLHNLLHFGRVLRALGLDVHAGRMLDVAAALPHIDIGRRTDFYATLQSLLIHRQQDLATFDEAFRVFWRPPSGDWSSTDLGAMGERRRTGAPHIEIPASQPESGHEAGLPVRGETRRIVPTSSSPREVSRATDFAELSEEEVDQAKAMIAALRWDVGMRRTRRWRAGDGPALDLQKVVRRNLGYGGEPVALPRRERLSKRRPLVVICDVSGSMERYARLLLHFIGQMAGRLAHVDAFVFATRLTRITRELGWRGSRHSLPAIPRRVPDWAGGTRIGDALRTFNVEWARRVMGHGPVVLLISDGWDRGEPDRLAREMSRLQRSCHRLIWLNPLLGAADYQPLTRGMQAALPFVDDFLPVHNLASLEALAEHLNRLPRAAGRDASSYVVSGFRAWEEMGFGSRLRASFSPAMQRRSVRSDMPNAPDLDSLLTILDQAYNHRSWHGTNLRGSIRGLSLKQAAWRPAPGRHNIWELVVHAAYWKYAARRRLSGGTRQSFPLKGSNWFERPIETTESAWRSDVVLLEDMHRSLRAAIANLPPATLHHRNGAGKETNFSLIAGVAAHDLYHAGQIQLLKRLART